MAKRTRYRTHSDVNLVKHESRFTGIRVCVINVLNTGITGIRGYGQTNVIQRYYRTISYTIPGSVPVSRCSLQGCKRVYLTEA